MPKESRRQERFPCATTRHVRCGLPARADYCPRRPSGSYYCSSFSHAVIGAGADVVFGSGPHVLGGMQWYKGRLIVYSLGNFTGYRMPATSGALGLSGILRLKLRSDGSFVSGRFVSTTLTNLGVAELDPACRAVELVQRLSDADFPKCGVRFSDGRKPTKPRC